MKQQEKIRAWFLNLLPPWQLTSHQSMKSKLTRPLPTTGKTEETSAVATTTTGGGAILPHLPQGAPTTANNKIRTEVKPPTTTGDKTTTGAKTTEDKARTEATATRPMIVSP